MLKTDKNEKFEIKGLEDFSIIRTGVEGDGSCFLHALFACMNSATYIGLSIEDRQKYVIFQRSELAKKITPTVWENMNGGFIASTTFEFLLRNILTAVFIKLGLKKKKIPKIEPSINLFLKTHIKAMSSYSPENWENFINHIVTNLPVNSDAESRKKILKDMNIPELICEFIEMCFLYSYNRAYTIYVKKLQELREDIGHEYIEFIIDEYKINCIIINQYGEIYRRAKDSSDMISNKQNFVLIYWNGYNHYEAIGCIRSGTIFRLFEPTDPIIRILLSLN